jgi:hypothetical protein
MIHSRSPNETGLQTTGVSAEVAKNREARYRWLYDAHPPRFKHTVGSQRDETTTSVYLVYCRVWIQ